MGAPFARDFPMKAPPCYRPGPQNKRWSVYGDYGVASSDVTATMGTVKVEMIFGKAPEKKNLKLPLVVPFRKDIIEELRVAEAGGQSPAVGSSSSTNSDRKAKSPAV